MNLEFLYDLFEKALTENLKKLNKHRNDESKKKTNRQRHNRVNKGLNVGKDSFLPFLVKL